MRKSVVFPFLRLALRIFLFRFLFAKETHAMCIQSDFDDDDDDDGFIESFSFCWFVGYPVGGPGYRST